MHSNLYKVTNIIGIITGIISFLIGMVILSFSASTSVILFTSMFILTGISSTVISMLNFKRRSWILSVTIAALLIVIPYVTLIGIILLILLLVFKNQEPCYPTNQV